MERNPTNFAEKFRFRIDTRQSDGSGLSPAQRQAGLMFDGDDDARRTAAIPEGTVPERGLDERRLTIDLRNMDNPFAGMPLQEDYSRRLTTKRFGPTDTSGGGLMAMQFGDNLGFAGTGLNSFQEAGATNLFGTQRFLDMRVPRANRSLLLF